MEKVSNRVAWIDNVKMLAMLFVILGHTWRVIHCPLPEWLGLFILSFNMALFVIMTGYTSVNAIGRIESRASLWNYIFKITKRIMVPSVVFGSVMSIILHCGKYAFTGDAHAFTFRFVVRIILVILFVIAYYYRDIKRGSIFYKSMIILSIPLAIKISSFWFLNMIWCVCVSVAIAAYLIKKANRGGYLLLYLLSFAISLIISFFYDKTSDFVHFFLIGYALHKYRIFDKIDNVVIMIFALSIGIALLFMLGEYPMNFWDNHFVRMLTNGEIHLYFLRILTSTIIGLSFMILTKLFSKQYNVFSTWGAMTLPLYMIHVMIVTIFYKLPISYKIEGWAYLVYAIPMTFVLTVSSILIISLFKKYSITKEYFLGEINSR